MDAFERVPVHEEDAQRDAQTNLPRQLHLPCQPFLVLPHHLYIVVGEADCAHPQRRDQREPDVDVGQIGPEKGGPSDGQQDDHPAHSGGSSLVGMAHDAGVFTFPDGFTDLLMGQPADDLLAGKKPDQQRRSGRQRRANRGELKDLKTRRLKGLFEPAEEVVEHGACD